ncbi:(Fe-S)-binding protein [Cytobacillus purgationiresistens]|uniref:Glycolate oxidase iron-sulfur subunit n=1 Tax=Cytobacillus purgationiresistens TaxID=863449 RepID=A0ABU0AJN1_9BACI|nr:(Fe-S)-binding protein [Cytobacillus purgationiresistens]MDQ0271457.1 glycolate oxidase iron-sulfur subunit [Cytobacillus purgationiresistens]
MTEHLAYKETFDCVQCGYCLPACPTYVSIGKESHSPRGRINLVQMAAEGKISIEEITDSMELCLGCRACETVCPTNVQYGKILESYKEVKAEEEKPFILNKLAMQKGLPNKKILSVLTSSLKLYQNSGLNKAARKTNLLGLLPDQLQAFEEITPAIEKPDKKLRAAVQFPPSQTKARIAFFTGCIMDVFFAKINDLSIKLLQHAGCEVTVIKEQTCCGALQNHDGDRSTSKKLAKENITAFEQGNYDYIVNSIGGCGAMLVEYDELLKDEQKWAGRAKAFAEKNKDVSVILNKLDIAFNKEMNITATYQPSCHLLNVQKVSEAPVQLLRSIPEITYIPLPKGDMCCGSAGIYNVVHYHESMDILDSKMENVKKIVPEMIVTSNPGCHLQMSLGVKREGLAHKVKVVHIVELLAEACGIK